VKNSRIGTTIDCNKKWTKNTQKNGFK